MELQALMARFKLKQLQTNQVSVPEKQPLITAETDVKYPKMITLDDDDFGKYWPKTFEVLTR